MESILEDIREVERSLNKGRGHTALRDICHYLQWGDYGRAYWATHNEWDKLRPYEVVHPHLARVPHLRKLFWEMLSMARLWGWEDQVNYWESLLSGYKEQRETDMQLKT